MANTLKFYTPTDVIWYEEYVKYSLKEHKEPSYFVSGKVFLSEGTESSEGGAGQAPSAQRAERPGSVQVLDYKDATASITEMMKRKQTANRVFGDREGKIYTLPPKTKGERANMIGRRDSPDSEIVIHREGGSNVNLDDYTRLYDYVWVLDLSDDWEETTLPLNNVGTILVDVEDSFEQDVRDGKYKKAGWKSNPYTIKIGPNDRTFFLKYPDKAQREKLTENGFPKTLFSNESCIPFIQYRKDDTGLQRLVFRMEDRKNACILEGKTFEDLWKDSVGSYLTRKLLSSDCQRRRETPGCYAFYNDQLYTVERKNVGPLSKNPWAVRHTERRIELMDIRDAVKRDFLGGRTGKVRFQGGVDKPTYYRDSIREPMDQTNRSIHARIVKSHKSVDDTERFAWVLINSPIAAPFENWVQVGEELTTLFEFWYQWGVVGEAKGNVEGMEDVGYVSPTYKFGGQTYYLSRTPQYASAAASNFMVGGSIPPVTIGLKGTLPLMQINTKKPESLLMVIRLIKSDTVKYFENALITDASAVGFATAILIKQYTEQLSSILNGVIPDDLAGVIAKFTGGV